MKLRSSGELSKGKIRFLGISYYFGKIKLQVRNLKSSGKHLNVVNNYKSVI